MTYPLAFARMKHAHEQALALAATCKIRIMLSSLEFQLLPIISSPMSAVSQYISPDLQQQSKKSSLSSGLSPRGQSMFDLHPQLSHSHIAWGVVFQRVEPARDHDRRAIQHSVVQPTLGYIIE